MSTSMKQISLTIAVVAAIMAIATIALVRSSSRPVAQSTTSILDIAQSTTSILD